MKLRLTAILFLLITIVAISCQNDEQVEFNRYYSGGSVIYQTHCQNCHGEKGEGMQLLIPPLNDAAYLKKNQNLLACYLKNGIKGKISISNHEFDDDMPAQDLSPMEIAKVLTYVTNSFGNKLGTISLQKTETDLKNCK